MSNGDVYGKPFRGQTGYKLLDQQILSGNGKWVDASNIKTASVYVDAIETGGKVELMGSLADDAPGDSVDGFVLLTINSANTNIAKIVSALSVVVRWIKAKKTDGGSGQVATTALLWGLSV